MDKDNIVLVKKIEDSNDVLLSYRVVWNTNINSFVPIDTANTHYQAIQEWVAEGGVIEEADV